MYLYNTIPKKSNLPIKGWLFPCYMCKVITSSYTKIIYKKYYYFRNIYLNIPLCNKCNLTNKPLIKRDQIIKIE